MCDGCCDAYRVACDQLLVVRDGGEPDDRDNGVEDEGHEHVLMERDSLAAQTPENRRRGFNMEGNKSEGNESPTFSQHL